jgi:hypothetical protein
MTGISVAGGTSARSNKEPRLKQHWSSGMPFGVCCCLAGRGLQQECSGTPLRVCQATSAVHAIAETDWNAIEKTRNTMTAFRFTALIYLLLISGIQSKSGLACTSKHLRDHYASPLKMDVTDALFTFFMHEGLD